MLRSKLIELLMKPCPDKDIEIYFLGDGEGEGPDGYYEIYENDIYKIYGDDIYPGPQDKDHNVEYLVLNGA